MNNSKKSLQAALRNALFDPRKPSAMTTIVTAKDPAYLVTVAQEVLRDVGHFSGEEKKARIRDAISILAYANTL